jgi:hypothetical protein
VVETNNLSDVELCDALRTAAEAGDMTDHDGLTNEVVRRFTEYVSEGMILQQDSMIRAIETRDNPHIEIGCDEHADTFTSIDIDGVRSLDEQPVVIDYSDGEPHLHVYNPDDRTPAVTIRFPTNQNAIEFPEVTRPW